MIVAAVVFVKCSKQYGIKSAVQWAALLVLSLFPFSLAGSLMARPVKFLWMTAKPEFRFGIVAAGLIGFTAAVKSIGLAETLRYAFAYAGFIAAVFLIGFGFLLILMVIGHGGF